MAMDFVIDKLQFLGLNEREVKVFTALATFGRMNMTKAATRANVPRTTVDAVMRRLVKQGLVFKERVNGHYEYFVNTDEVANTLDWIERRFRADQDQDGTVSVKESQEYEEKRKYDENIVSKGDEKVTFGELAKKHAGDRVRLLFSRGQNGREESVLRFSKYVAVSIENNLKLEILIDSTIADALIEKGSTPMPPQSNMVRLNIVPALYGVAVEDVFMFSDSLLLVNTERNECRKVQERVLVDLSKHLLDIACETGWSVDLTAWMNKV